MIDVGAWKGRNYRKMRARYQTVSVQIDRSSRDMCFLAVRRRYGMEHLHRNAAFCDARYERTNALITCNEMKW
jgi:hypothetical protein